MFVAEEPLARQNVVVAHIDSKSKVYMQPYMQAGLIDDSTALLSYSVDHWRKQNLLKMISAIRKRYGTSQLQCKLRLVGNGNNKKQRRTAKRGKQNPGTKSKSQKVKVKHVMILVLVYLAPRNLKSLHCRARARYTLPSPEAQNRNIDGSSFSLQ